MWECWFPLISHRHPTRKIKFLKLFFTVFIEKNSPHCFLPDPSPDVLNNNTATQNCWSESLWRAVYLEGWPKHQGHVANFETTEAHKLGLQLYSWKPIHHTLVDETDCTRHWICIYLLTCLRLKKQTKDDSWRCFQNRKRYNLMTPNKNYSQKIGHSSKAEAFSCYFHNLWEKYHTWPALCARLCYTCIREVTSLLVWDSQQYSPYLGRRSGHQPRLLNIPDPEPSCLSLDTFILALDNACNVF